MNLAMSSSSGAVGASAAAMTTNLIATNSLNMPSSSLSSVPTELVIPPPQPRVVKEGWVLKRGNHVLTFTLKLMSLKYLIYWLLFYIR